MRHRVYGRKLNRDTEHRRAMFRNLAAGLFEHGQIQTTLPKAKAVQPFVERLVTLAKRGDLHARRQAIALLRDRIMCDNEEKIERDRYGEVRRGPKLIRHLFENIGPQYADRDGGYTRIIHLARRRIGDGTQLVLLQLVSDEMGPEIGSRESLRSRKADRRREFAEKLGVWSKDGGAKGGGASAAATATADADADADADASATEASSEAAEAAAASDAAAAADAEAEANGGSEQQDKG
ncbi:MAG: 50S ribosomal protein L17 [Planctomycetota bacterium]